MSYVIFYYFFDLSQQALLGFEKNVTHMDGHNLHIARKGVTQPGWLG